MQEEGRYNLGDSKGTPLQVGTPWQTVMSFLLADVTVEVYTLSLKECTKLKGLLEVVSPSTEFETIPIHCHDSCLGSLRYNFFGSFQIGRAHV